MGIVETLAESGEQAEEESFPVGRVPGHRAASSSARRPCRSWSATRLADRAEVELMLSLGYRSLLMVPVVHRGESLGIVEAMCHEERPWTRTEINRARIIANQLASVIQSLFRASGPGALRLEAAAARESRGARSPGRPHIWTTSARPSCASRTRSSPPIPSRSSLVEHALDGLGRGGVTEPVGDVDPPVPVGPRVRLGVHLGEHHRGVDVARLVGDPQVELEVRPVVRQGLDAPPGSPGERHRPKPSYG